MDLTLTRDEWERIAADGEGVLFRPGEWDTEVFTAGDGDPGIRAFARPPAEFVEAAKPCETCHGQRKIRVPYSPVVVEVFNTSLIDCPDCLSDGRRRIAVAVPCDFCRGNTPPKNVVAAPCWKCSGQKGLTVGHVVVEWGPWSVVESWVGARANPHKVACLSHNGFLDWRWSSDDLTLVGQYALGIKVVEP